MALSLLGPLASLSFLGTLRPWAELHPSPEQLHQRALGGLAGSSRRPTPRPLQASPPGALQTGVPLTHLDFLGGTTNQRVNTL